jgi:hypothetical protein
MGRCPIPHSIFEKSEAKTFMCGFATVGVWGVIISKEISLTI